VHLDPNSHHISVGSQLPSYIRWIPTTSGKILDFGKGLTAEQAKAKFEKMHPDPGEMMRIITGN
jgi:hypothetical protein